MGLDPRYTQPFATGIPLHLGHAFPPFAESRPYSMDHMFSAKPRETLIIDAISRGYRHDDPGGL